MQNRVGFASGVFESFYLTYRNYFKIFSAAWLARFVLNLRTSRYLCSTTFSPSGSCCSGHQPLDLTIVRISRDLPLALI
jgi:hypothetical protein